MSLCALTSLVPLVALVALVALVRQVKLICKDDRSLSRTSPITQAAREVLQRHGVQPAWAVIELAEHAGRLPPRLVGRPSTPLTSEWAA